MDLLIVFIYFDKSSKCKKIKTLWLNAIKNIVPLNWKEVPYEDKVQTPDEEWYDQHGIDISKLKITDLFKVMNLFAIAGNVTVKMGGDNTKRFEYINNEKIFSNKRIRYNTLKNSMNTIADYNEYHLMKTIDYASSANIYKMGMSFDNAAYLVEKFGNIYDKLLHSILFVDDITMSGKTDCMKVYILDVKNKIEMCHFLIVQSFLQNMNIAKKQPTTK